MFGKYWIVSIIATLFLCVMPTYAVDEMQIRDDFIVSLQIYPSLEENLMMQHRWMDLIDDLGISWIGLPIKWSDVEPERDEYNWKWLDGIIGIASQRGNHVMISVYGTPNWARSLDIDLEHDAPPNNTDEFINFLTHLFNRYTDKIHAIEVWKEPNLIYGWNTIDGVSPSNYLDFLRLATQTIKSIAPHVIVISSSLAVTGVNIVEDGKVLVMDDSRYLTTLLNLGMLDIVDCVGINHHGYNIDSNAIWDIVPNDETAIFRGVFDNRHPSWSFRSTLEIYADKIQSLGDNTPLCVTQFGWGSSEGLDDIPLGYEFFLDNTRQEQADWMVEALNNMDEWGFVWIANMSNLNYGFYSDSTDYMLAYSFIDADMSPYPISHAISMWMSTYAND